MGVIVMSPARSGTTSVEKALTHLGFRVYEGMKHGFLVSVYDYYQLAMSSRPGLLTCTGDPCS